VPNDETHKAQFLMVMMPVPLAPVPQTQCPLAMQRPELAESATAEFLLSRGPFAWIGYGWSNCASAKGTPSTFLYAFDLREYPCPRQWDEDYGGECCSALSVVSSGIIKGCVFSACDTRIIQVSQAGRGVLPGQPVRLARMCAGESSM
jgi:hypothetical protein